MKEKFLEWVSQKEESVLPKSKNKTLLRKKILIIALLIATFSTVIQCVFLK